MNVHIAKCTRRKSLNISKDTTVSSQRKSIVNGPGNGLSSIWSKGIVYSYTGLSMWCMLNYSCANMQMISLSKGF